MSQQSVLQRVWLKWKSLHLPWRQRFLVGNDLKGNTYWEFRISGVSDATRARRIVYYPRSTHLSDVKVPPLWHQWLRYTRDNPPTLEEQVSEQQRQERMRVLAAQADARWAAKPRVGESDMSAQSRITGDELASKALENSTPAARSGGKRDGGEQRGEGPNPWGQWERAQETKEQWQPVAWSPTPKQKV